MLYEEFCKRVENGQNYSIDFQRKECKLNGKVIRLENQTKNMTEILHDLDILYTNFKYSYPSERSKYRKKYFVAVPLEELTDEQLCTGEERILAKAKLEGYLLAMILNGSFVWQENMGKWFYKSQNSDLTLLKEWI